MKLYNFTNRGFAISNIDNHRLKISRISDLNDPFELISVILNIEYQRNALETFKKDTNSKYGLICFSSSWNNPVLWGHYADKHQGIALGFDVSKELLFQVKYTHRRFNLPIDKINNQLILNEATLEKILSTKFKDWQYESEWRFFCKLTESKFEDTSECYFEKFSETLCLTEVILGAQCELTIEEMLSILNNSGLSDQIKVSKAKFANNTFKIIKDT